MLHRLQTTGLTSRLTAMVVGVVIVFSLAVGVLMWQVVSSVMEEDLHNRGLAIATDLAQNVKNPIQTGNLPALDELIHNVKSANAIIEYIFITDDSGNVMVYTFNKGMPQGLLLVHKFTSEADTVYLNTDRGRMQDISVPIEDGSLGYIRMGINDRELVGLWHSNIKKLVGLTILVILIGSLIVYQLTRKSVAPLELLMRRAEQIAGGVYDGPAVKVVGHDEIGRLTEAMNTMQQSLYRSSEERRQLISYLISVQENERKRISLELHDESGQALTAIMLSMRALANSIIDEQQKQLILDVRNEVSHTLGQIRQLAVELRPPALDELGLEMTLENLIAFYGDQGIMISFSYDVIETPVDAVSTAIYRIVQEGLNNVVRHAEATKAYVSLKQKGNVLYLELGDNGKGLTYEMIATARSRNRMGIYGMEERVRIIGGTWELITDNPMWHTLYRITIPGHGAISSAAVLPKLGNTEGIQDFVDRTPHEKLEKNENGSDRL